MKVLKNPPKQTNLIPPAQIPNEQKKLTSTFIFTLFCGASKGFMEALMALTYVSKKLGEPKHKLKLGITIV